MKKRSEIRIRDPFILTDKENGCYYMYGTTALNDGAISAKTTFSVYRSEDLENFEGPKVVCDGSGSDFWAERDFWAPEVHRYNGRYYLFGSCKAADKCRGTQIFVSDTPDGMFMPISKYPATPRDWECLDGTLYVENGVPYMVFCHEWVQIKDGEICAVQLSDDLSEPVGEPFILFKASQTKAGEYRVGNGDYVTDGPFLWHDGSKLRMIWSSFCDGRYQVLEAESDSLRGEWTHHGGRFDFDGGHAMIFERLDGQRMISLHTPNKPGLERAVFFEFDK